MRTSSRRHRPAFIPALLLGGSAAVTCAAIFLPSPGPAGVTGAPTATTITITTSSTARLAARLRAHVRALTPARADPRARALAAALAPDLASMPLPASMRQADAWPGAMADADANADAGAVAAADRQAGAARYIAATLRAAGYTVQRGDAGTADGTIEASPSNPAPDARPVRTFVIGAHYGDAAPGDGSPCDAGGVAAVLELASLLKAVRPSRGTDIRFVFVEGCGSPVDDGFIAFAGTPAEARRVRQALAAFQDATDGPVRGLAAHAYGQGGVLFASDGPGAQPALLVTGTAFLRYPYYATGPIADNALDAADDAASAALNDAAVARVLAGLARTIEALAADRQG